MVTCECEGMIHKFTEYIKHDIVYADVVPVMYDILSIYLTSWVCRYSYHFLCHGSWTEDISRVYL